MITLELPSGELPRHLRIRLEGSGPHLTALIADGYQPLVNARDYLADCSLCVVAKCLAVGSASFYLTAAETERVKDVFGPQGLRVLVS